MDRQTLRDWVHRFNAPVRTGFSTTGPRAPSRAFRAEQLAELAEIVETGPDRAEDGVVRWRRIDLKRVIARALRRRLSRAQCREASEAARLLPHQRPAASSGAGRSGRRGVQKNFPRTLKAHLAGIATRTPIEIWFQDEARIGQKNGLVRQWARRGTRPRQPADQRYESAYLFGAICPARGIGAALALPYADTHACSFISTRSPAMSQRAPTPSCCSIAPGSRGSSPGSAEIGGSGKTPRRRSPPPEPSSTPLPLCSSSANWDAHHEFRIGLSAAPVGA